MNDPQRYDVYALAIMDSDGNMTYLKPRNNGDIVAVAQTQEPYVFRLTRI